MLLSNVVLSSRITLDYRQLNDDYKDLDEADEIKKRGDKMQRAINSLMDTIQRIQAPNMKVKICHFLTFLRF